MLSRIGVSVQDGLVARSKRGSVSREEGGTSFQIKGELELPETLRPQELGEEKSEDAFIKPPRLPPEIPPPAETRWP